MISTGSVAGGGDTLHFLLGVGCVGGGVAVVCRFLFFGVVDGMIAWSRLSSSSSICTGVDDDIFTASAAEAARPFDIFGVDVFFRSRAFGGCPMPHSELCLWFFCCGGVIAMDSPKSLITKSGTSLHSSGNACV